MLPFLQIPLPSRQIVMVKTIDGKLDCVSCYMCNSNEQAEEFRKDMYEDRIAKAIENKYEYTKDLSDYSIDITDDSHTYRWEYRIVRPIAFFDPIC